MVGQSFGRVSASCQRDRGRYFDNRVVRQRVAGRIEQPLDPAPGGPSRSTSISDTSGRRNEHSPSSWHHRQSIKPVRKCQDD